MKATDIPAILDRGGFDCEDFGDGIYRVGLEVSPEDDGPPVYFDLYAVISTELELEYLRLIVTPVAPANPGEELPSGAYLRIAELNYETPLIRFAVDTDGDICLVDDIPAAEASTMTGNDLERRIGRLSNWALDARNQLHG